MGEKETGTPLPKLNPKLSLKRLLWPCLPITWLVLWLVLSAASVSTLSNGIVSYWSWTLYIVDHMIWSKWYRPYDKFYDSFYMDHLSDYGELSCRIRWIGAEDHFEIRSVIFGGFERSKCYFVVLWTVYSFEVTFTVK